MILTLSKIRAVSYIAAVSVLIMTLCSKIQVFLPFSPVPITLGVLGPLLVGMQFKKEGALIGIGAYIALMALGLPLGSHPLGIYGPTAGFIIGFFPMAYLAAFFTQVDNKQGLLSYLLKSFICLMALYLCGWGFLALSMPLKAILQQSVFFMCVDMAKLSLAYPLYVLQKQNL